MDAHLADDDFQALRQGTLAGPRLVEVDDHLAECDACRARALAAAVPEAAHLLAALTAAEHLSEDVVLAVARDAAAALSARDRAHLDGCATCAEEIAQLRTWLASDTPQVSPVPPAAPAWSASRWLAAAAAVLLVVGLPLWLVTRAVPDATSTAGALDALTGPQRQRVEALVGGAAPPNAAVLDTLRGDREVQMGTAPIAASFRLRSPVATSVREASPAFEWEPVPGAVGYEVAVFSERAEPVAASALITGTRWVPADPLPEGVVLVWQVTAVSEQGQRTVAPAAPAPPARFRVVPADVAAGVLRLEREHPDAHLAIGAAAFDAGLVADAERHLRSVAAGTPGWETAQRLLARLHVQAR